MHLTGIVMSWTAAKTATFCVASLLVACWVNDALASQGPGAGAGTASHLIQSAMAVLVYGMSTLVIGAGLIGALRRH
jgi:hypothetical protein